MKQVDFLYGRLPLIWLVIVFDLRVQMSTSKISNEWTWCLREVFKEKCEFEKVAVLHEHQHF